MTAPQRPTPSDTFAASLPLDWNHHPADATEGWEMLCRAAARYRSLERSLSERAEECERLRGLLREAAKLLWSHNGAGQEKAWALSEKIDAFSAAEAGGARDRTTK